MSLRRVVLSLSAAGAASGLSGAWLAHSAPLELLAALVGGASFVVGAYGLTRHGLEAPRAALIASALAVLFALPLAWADLTVLVAAGGSALVLAALFFPNAQAEYVAGAAALLVAVASPAAGAAVVGIAASQTRIGWRSMALFAPAALATLTAPAAAPLSVRAIALIVSILLGVTMAVALPRLRPSRGGRRTTVFVAAALPAFALAVLIGVNGRLVHVEPDALSPAALLAGMTVGASLGTAAALLGALLILISRAPAREAVLVSLLLPLPIAALAGWPGLAVAAPAVAAAGSAGVAFLPPLLRTNQTVVE